MQKWVPLTFVAAVPVAVIAAVRSRRNGTLASRRKKGLLQFFDKKTRKRIEAFGSSAVRTIPPQLRSIVSKS